MGKKFTILRIVSTLWKILAWIVLVVGILSSIGALLVSGLGGTFLPDLMRQMGMGEMPVSPAMGWIGGIIALFGTLFATVVQFLGLYALGEFISLMLSIEENTRQLVAQAQWAPEAPSGGQTYSPPPPPQQESPTPPAQTPHSPNPPA